MKNVYNSTQLNVSGSSFKCLCKPGTQPTALAADLLATSSTVTGLCTRLPAPAPGQARPDMLPVLHNISLIPSCFMDRCFG